MEKLVKFVIAFLAVKNDESLSRFKDLKILLGKASDVKNLVKVIQLEQHPEAPETVAVITELVSNSVIFREWATIYVPNFSDELVKLSEGAIGVTDE